MHERVFAGLAASLLLGGGIWAAGAQDLDARKSPQQLFSTNCSACHRSPQGLMKAGSASSVASFLRQHYTSGPASASALARYLASVGPGNPRAVRQPGTLNRAEETAAGPDRRGERQRGRTDPNAQRLEQAARAEAERRRAAEPPGLSWGRSIVPRPPGEPATVSADPPSILIAADPKPVVPRLAARGQGVVPAAPTGAGAGPATATGATSSSQPTEAATAATGALPAPSAPGSNAAAAAVSQPSAASPSGVARPEPSTAAGDLPAYPPPLDLELGGVNDNAVDHTTSSHDRAQRGFSAPLP